MITMTMMIVFSVLKLLVTVVRRQERRTACKISLQHISIVRNYDWLPDFSIDKLHIYK